MLNEKTISTARTAAAGLSESGLILQAKPDTILAQIVQLSSEFFDSSLNDSTDELAYKQIEHITLDTEENSSQHSLITGEAVDALSSAVVKHVNVAKNVVKPLVIDFSERLHSFRETNKELDAADGLDIRPMYVPKVATMDLLTSSLDAYLGQTVIKPSSKAYLKEKTSSEVIELLLTGSNNLDQKIMELVSDLGEDVIRDVYTSFFTTAEPSSVFNCDNISRMHVYDRLNYGLILYLLARKLVTTTDEIEDWNVSLDVYKGIIAEFKTYGGALASNALEQISRLVRTNQLVLRRESGNKVLIVVGENYDSWLKEAGSPEVILGLMISNGTETSLNVISEKSEEFLAKWRSYCVFQQSQQSNKLFEIFKDYTISTFKTMLDDSSEVEKKYMLEHPEYRNNIEKMLTEHMDSFRSKDLNDIDELALVLIAKIRFYYTSSYSILTDINAAFEANENVDVREAALLAVVNYVADYITDQISVKKWV